MSSERSFRAAVHSELKCSCVTAHLQPLVDVTPGSPWITAGTRGIRSLCRRMAVPKGALAPRLSRNCSIEDR